MLVVPIGYDCVFYVAGLKINVIVIERLTTAAKKIDSNFSHSVVAIESLKKAVSDEYYCKKVINSCPTR